MKLTLKKLVGSAVIAVGMMTAFAPAPAKAQGADGIMAEITYWAGNFAPRGWAFCDGQLLPISQNTALFSLLGTTYGGDGRTTFALPNFKGRTIVHPGRGPGLTVRRLGQLGGAATETLTIAQMPSHGHGVDIKASSAAADGTSPDQAALAESTAEMYLEGAAPSVLTTTLHAGTLSGANSGGGQAHENRQPYLALNCIIRLQGLYPSRS